VRYYIRRSSNSIRSQLIWSFSAMLVLELLVYGIAAGYLYERTLKENNNEYVSEMLYQLNGIIDNYISYMEDISSVVLQHRDVRLYLEAGETGSDETVLRRSISAFLQSIIDVRTDVVNIILLMDHGGFISDNEADRLNSAVDYRTQSWYRLAAFQDDSPYISSSHVQNVISGAYPWVITISRALNGHGPKKGVLLVDLNFNIIRELCSNIRIGDKGYVFIINHLGEIVYHPRQDLIYNDLKHERIDKILEQKNGSLTTRVDDTDILYTFVTSGKTSWTIVGVSSVREILSSKRELQYYLWLLVIFTFSIVIVISTFLSGRIVRPIEVLRRSMKEVERGNFDLDIHVECDHEVFDLAEDCNIAIKKIKDLIVQNEQAQELKRKNEFKALQAQINPHFLYNTLDSIIWLVEGNENDDAVMMTEQLADFFRLSLNKGQEIIPIRQVIDHITCYLSIQKMRYKKKLDYQILVDPAIYSCYSLKLLLQPLVENSIYHGIKNRSLPGMITIRGKMMEDHIEFSVEDNGTGMKPEILEMLERGEIPESSRSGMGLKNVRERIQLFFGKEYDLAVSSSFGGGTVIRFSIPVIKEPPT